MKLLLDMFSVHNTSNIQSLSKLEPTKYITAMESYEINNHLNLKQYWYNLV